VALRPVWAELVRWTLVAIVIAIIMLIAVAAVAYINGQEIGNERGVMDRPY
jgi:hypothetical protein